MKIKLNMCEIAILSQLAIYKNNSPVGYNQIHSNPLILSHGLITSISKAIKNLQKRKLITEGKLKIISYSITEEGRIALKKVLNENPKYFDEISGYFPQIEIEKRFETIEVLIFSSLLVYGLIGLMDNNILAGTKYSNSYLLIVFLFIVAFYVMAAYSFIIMSGYAFSTIARVLRIHFINNIIMWIKNHRKTCFVLVLILANTIAYFSIKNILPDKIKDFYLWLILQVLGIIIRIVYNWSKYKKIEI